MIVVNNDLCSIIKINQSTFINIDKVKNIIIYFIYFFILFIF